MKGDKEFKANLHKAIVNSIKGAKTGMKLGAALIKTESQKRTPVDEGNLKGSHYAKTHVSGAKITIEIGLTAKYAVYVHEIIDKYVRKSTGTTITYTHTNGEPKFLERAIDAKKKDVLKLVQKHARLK